MTNTPTAPLDADVTQADRKAAAEFYQSHLSRPSEVPVAAAMRVGHIDESPLIQAFARHRLASTQGSQGREAEAAMALDEFAYDELWGAIADATRIEGGIIAISVVKFREAIRALTPDREAEAISTASEGDDPCEGGQHCCCCDPGEPCCDCGTVMPSKTCIGEKCWCGAPAAKKVGEEIAFDDPSPDRHNMTTYICAPHYAQMMGPMGAKQVGSAASPKVASDTAPGVEGLDERCGFHAPTAFQSPRSAEWRSACEHLASRYDFWKMPDRATAIRAGEPGWLIEQACVEAILAALSASPSQPVEGAIAAKR